MEVSHVNSASQIILTINCQRKTVRLNGNATANIQLDMGKNDVNVVAKTSGGQDSNSVEIHRINSVDN